MGITKEQAIAERERRRNLSSGASSHSSVTKEQAIAERERRRSLASQEPHRETSIGEDIWSGIKNVPGQGWGAVGRDIGNRAAEFAGDIGHMFMHPIESAKQTYGMGKEINAGISQLEHARGKKNLFAGLEQFGRGVLNTPSNIVDYGHKFGVIPDWIQAWKPNEDVQNFDYAKHLGIEGEEAGDKFTRGLGEQLPYLAAGEIGLARAPAAGRFARILQTVRNVAQRSGAQAAHAVGKNEDAVKAALMYPAGELGLRAIGALGRTALKGAKHISTTLMPTKFAKLFDNEATALLDQYRHGYNSLWEATDNAGIHEALPRIPDNLDDFLKEAPRQYREKLRETLSNPTTRNLHEVYKDLGAYISEIRATQAAKQHLPSAIQDAAQVAGEMRSNIKETLNASLERAGGQPLANEFALLNHGWEHEVMPRIYNPQYLKYKAGNLSARKFMKYLDKNDIFDARLRSAYPQVGTRRKLFQALKIIGLPAAAITGYKQLVND